MTVMENVNKFPLRVPQLSNAIKGLEIIFCVNFKFMKLLSKYNLNLKVEITIDSNKFYFQF